MTLWRRVRPDTLELPEFGVLFLLVATIVAGLLTRVAKAQKPALDLVFPDPVLTITGAASLSYNSVPWLILLLARTEAPVWVSLVYVLTVLIYLISGYLLHSGNPYMLWSRIAVESELCRTTTRPAPVRWTRRQHGADSRSPRQDPPDTWPRSQLTRCRSHWRPSPTSGGGRSLAPNAALSSLRRVEAGILAVTVTTPGSSERHARRLTAAQIPEDFGESRERANHYMLGSPE